MNFVLLNSILLPLAALVAVPVLLHLFARTRPPVYKFSSIEFIMRIIRQTNRIKKPQDWIILVVRTLIFAAIILMFLQPLYFSKRRISSRFERKNVVVVVDSTASMGYAEGGQTRFAAACAQASTVLSGLSAGDVANVVWLKARPASVFPELGVNLTYLQSELRRARVTSEAGDSAGALRMAFQLLEKAEGRREVFVVSDFQKSQWEKVDMRPPPGVELVNVRIGSDQGANGVISDVYFDPPGALANEEIAVCCDVYNFSPEPRRRTVFASIRETRDSQDLMIPPWQKASAVFRHKFNAAGVFPVSVTLNEDSFAGDDRRWGLVDIQDSMHVGICGSDKETADTWRRALDAMGWARVEMTAADDTQRLRTFGVVMVAGDDGSILARLAGRSDMRNTVVWTPAAGAKWTGPASTNVGPVAFRWETVEKPKKLRVMAASADVFKAFAGGEFGDPARGNFTGRFVPDGQIAGGEVLASYDDNVPALMRFRSGASSFFLWNITVKREFSNYASRSGYLPLLGELLLTSRGRSDAPEAGRYFVCGERILRRLDGDVPAAEVVLKDADGNRQETKELRSSRDISVVASGSPEPGLYTWEHQARMLGYAAVNFPVVESDLRTFAVAELDKRGGTGVGEGMTIQWMRDGIPLWPWLLGLAALLALAESAALAWFEKT